MSYLTRAMQSSDRRFAQIFKKLGHNVGEPEQAEPGTDTTQPLLTPNQTIGGNATSAGDQHNQQSLISDSSSELETLRAEYQEKAGKKPHGNWKEDTLRQKLAELEGE